MSTNCTIAIKTTEGIKAIQCHWGGYPKCNGRILLRSYTNAQIIEELISLGSISVLGDSLYPNPAKAHTMDNPQQDVTLVYIRDCGYDVEDESFQVFNTQKDLLDNYSGDYNYLFKNNKWYVNLGTGYSWKELTEQICEKYNY